MPSRETPSETLSDFEPRLFSRRGETKRVFVSGAGPVRAYRFEGDRFCPAARFAAYRRALGDRFESRVLPDSAANPAPRLKMPHAVLTAHLIDEAGQPTRESVDEVIAFFRMRLDDATKQ